MIILFVPGLGILAYLVVEVIPGLLRGRATARCLRPCRLASIRHVNTGSSRARVETVPSVANFRALADECVRLERHEEAIDLYKSALTGMHETEPGAMLGLATAEFRKGDANAASGLGNHSFRATGIMAYLKNGGTLEKAAAMANHASTRTMQLYGPRRDELSLDEIERIVI